MNWIDWAILAVLALSTAVSLWRGFVREALSLLSWIAAFMVATAFGARLAGHAVDWVAHDGLRHALAYVLLFVAVLLLGSLLSALLARVIKVTGLTGADRLLGTVFGFARGVVILLLLLFVFRQLVPAAGQQALERSWFVPHLELVWAWAERNFTDAARGELPWPDAQ